MPAIYHEGSWLGNATDPEVLVKDTVGWTGKNRAYSQTNNAVIAHIENGITYDVSWTGSATVTLKKNSASGATITSGSTSPLSFTADADYELYFGSSATVTNIMVKDSRITDPTYEPYHESVEVMYEEEIHGVNLFDDSKIEVGTAWNGGTNVNRARNIIPCEPNKEYVVSINGTNNLDNVFFALSASIPPASQTAITSFPYTIRTGASDKYITLGFNKTNIALSDVTSLNIMLRKADIEDSTYRPYNPQAIQNQLNAQGVLGAKNLLKYNAGIVPGYAITSHGITCVVNDDYSVTANGTREAGSGGGGLGVSTTYEYPPGDYIVSGCPKGGSTSTYMLYVGDSSRNLLVAETGSGARIHISTKQIVKFEVHITSGTTVNNLVFKPMLRLASDPDDTYQPPAMTNRELTEEKINIADLKTVVSASSDFADFKTRIASL